MTLYNLSKWSVVVLGILSAFLPAEQAFLWGVSQVVCVGAILYFFGHHLRPR
jgi:hypothetical protein